MALKILQCETGNFPSPEGNITVKIFCESVLIQSTSLVFYAIALLYKIPNSETAKPKSRLIPKFTLINLGGN